MRLTPLDIKKQDFGRVLRGFDPDEVHAFLSMVADEWEDVRAEHRRMESKLRELEAKLEHYEKVEEALQEALQTAREQSQSKLEQAERHAALTIQEARGKAREIVQNAEHRRHQLQDDIERLSERRDEVIARLRAFLNSELEVLTRFGGAHPLESEDAQARSTRENDSGNPAPGAARSASPFPSQEPEAVSDNADEGGADAEEVLLQPEYPRPSAAGHSQETVESNLRRMNASEAADEGAETGEVPFSFSDDQGDAHAEPSPAQAAAREPAEKEDEHIDDAIFGFFDLDDDEEAGAERDHPMAARTLGRLEDRTRTQHGDVAPESEDAYIESDEAGEETSEPEGNDEIERIRRMLDELE